MPANSHYSGRLQSAVDEVISKSPQKFYEIFNSHDFFDVADPNNSLTDEQRAQVPDQNQRRFSQFSLAISDMINFVLGGDDGLLSKYTQEIIDKLDARASMNAAELNVLGASLSAVPALAPVNGAMKSAESQTGAAMGTSAYNPDMIPPITAGMPGLPPGVANAFEAGFFQPNWSFIYDHETVKNSHFYVTADGLKIGAGIPVSGMKEIYLKKIFGVNGVDSALNPVGDLAGGLDSDDFNTILDASKATDYSPYLKGGAKAGFSLNEIQMRNTFNRYVTNSLWEPIKNASNWANGHWGALVNNSCPEPVKTAVCDYIWNQGMALEPTKSDEAALISYLVTIGLYYLIGYQYKMRITPTSVDKDAVGNKITAGSSGYADVVGVLTDKGIANTYFTWAAEVILRSTNLTTDDSLGATLRKRRIDEANLIFKHVGLPVIEYGTMVSNIPNEHQPSALIENHFGDIARDGFVWYRYNNTGVAGGEGDGGSLATPTTLKASLTFGANANPEPVTQGIQNYIRSLMDQAGVKSAVITSTTRTAVDQARAMYGNLAGGVEIQYGPAGRAVTATFYQKKSQGSSASDTQAAMVSTEKQQPEWRVSRHCADFNVKVVFDIGPNSISPQSARGAFQALLKSAEADTSAKIVTKVLTPEDNDPAIHIEIDPTKVAGFQAHPNRAMPDIKFTLSNTTLTKQNAWMAPMSADYIAKQSENSIESKL